MQKIEFFIRPTKDNKFKPFDAGIMSVLLKDVTNKYVPYFTQEMFVQHYSKMEHNDMCQYDTFGI